MYLGCRNVISTPLLVTFDIAMVVCTDHCLQADVIFTIEGTAINGAYINDLKTNYIIPSLEYFGQGNVVEEVNYLSESTNSKYGMVVYQAADCLPSPSTDAMGPFSSPSRFMQAFDKLELIGGKGESHANIAEGLATALACFEELQQKRDTVNNVQKHCILVCNSPPYLLPVMESQTYAGKTAEQLAGVLQERGINLSIISPRKIPSLYKIFEKAGGDLIISQTKNYAKDPRHLVLLKGFSLKERPLTPPSGAIPTSIPLHQTQQQSQPTQLPPNVPNPQQQQQTLSAPHTIASMPSPLPPSSGGGATDGSGLITQQAQMPPNVGGMVGGPVVGGNTVTSTVMNQNVGMPPGAGAGIVGPGLPPPPSMFRNNAAGMPQMGPGMPGMPQNPGMMNPNMVNTVRGGMVGFTNNPLQGPPGYPGTQGMGQRPQNRWPMLPPGQQQRTPYMPNQQVNNPGQSSALIAQLTQPPPNMPGASVNQFPQIGNNPQMTPQQQQQQQQIRINLINQQQQQQGQQQQMMNQGVPGMQQVSNPNQMMQQNQIVTSQAQLGPGNPSMVPGRQTIWTGLLEWLEKVKNPADQTKIPQHVPCSVSANVKEGEPELSAESWPSKLIMQLMPKHLIGNIGGAYLKNSKSVLFHPTACEALESLTKVMSNGFAGCVHFTSTVPNPSCDIKVLILLYTPEKKAYLGFIPNDQGAFVDRLRKVIQQQKSTQMMRQGTGGPPIPGQSNQPPGGPPGGPGGVPGGAGTPPTTQNQSGPQGQQQPQQQQQAMMMSQSNPMNPMVSGGQMTQQQQQQQGMAPGGPGGPGVGPGMGGPGGPVGPGGPGGGPGGMGGMGPGVGGGAPMGMSGMSGPGGGPVGAGMQPRMRMPGMGQSNQMAPSGAPGGGVNPGGVSNPNRNMSPGMMVGGPVPVQQQQQQQLQVERQANLDKIGQLRQTLEAAQQQEQQYKNQLEQISHMKTSQLQEALQLAQQQELQYKILDQQRMANQSQQANAQQQRMMRPVMANNPGLRHLLQQQPQQYRQQLMGMPNMGGGPRGPQIGQPMQNSGNNQVQFDDVGNFDMF